MLHMHVLISCSCLVEDIMYIIGLSPLLQEGLLLHEV